MINIHTLPFRKDFNLWNIVYILQLRSSGCLQAEMVTIQQQFSEVRVLVCLLLSLRKEGMT